MDTNANMRIYDRARTVPDTALRPINAGRLRGMSDINPMWRLKTLTELFGPCGIGWWYEIRDERIVDDAKTNQSAAFVDILLYYKDPDTGELYFSRTLEEHEAAVRIYAPLWQAYDERTGAQ